MHKKLIYFFLVILWMNVIFFYSSEVGDKSDARSEKIAVGVYSKIEKIVPNLSLDSEDFNYLVRKLGHIGEYFVLTFLILGLLFTVNIGVKYKYIFAWLISAVYAVIDEYNQVFVHGRDGSFRDVIIDNIGILTAVILYMAVRHRYSKA